MLAKIIVNVFVRLIEMKVFTCVDHDAHWPVGVASLVVAEDKEKAYYLLAIQLTDNGLSTTSFTLQEVDLSKEQAIILHDGNY